MPDCIDSSLTFSLFFGSDLACLQVSMAGARCCLEPSVADSWSCMLVTFPTVSWSSFCSSGVLWHLPTPRSWLASCETSIALDRSDHALCMIVHSYLSCLLVGRLAHSGCVGQCTSIQYHVGCCTWMGPMTGCLHAKCRYGPLFCHEPV